MKIAKFFSFILISSLALSQGVHANEVEDAYQRRAEAQDQYDREVTKIGADITPQKALEIRSRTVDKATADYAKASLKFNQNIIQNIVKYLAEKTKKGLAKLNALGTGDSKSEAEGPPEPGQYQKTSKSKFSVSTPSPSNPTNSRSPLPKSSGKPKPIPQIITSSPGGKTSSSGRSGKFSSGVSRPEVVLSGEGIPKEIDFSGSSAPSPAPVVSPSVE